MKSLKVDDAPMDIEIGDGETVSVIVRARPITSHDMSVARAAAQRFLDDLADGAAACRAAGLIGDDNVVDVSDPDVRAAFFHDMVTIELGVRQIMEFVDGVQEDDGSVPPAEPKYVRALLRQWPFGDNFYRGITRRQMELLAAKKGCGTAARGTSGATAVPNIARDAGETDCPAPTESRD